MRTTIAAFALTMLAVVVVSPAQAQNKVRAAGQPSPVATDISAAYRYYGGHRVWRPYRRAYYARPYYYRSYYRPWAYSYPYYSYASYYPRPYYYRPFRPFVGLGYPFGFGVGFGIW